MKTLFKYSVAAAAVAGVIGFSGQALAQTQNVLVNAEVANALTLAATDADLGPIIAVPSSGGGEAYITYQGDGTAAATNGGGATDARMEDFDLTSTPAAIAVSNGVNGAGIDVDIPVGGITEVTDGTGSFSFSDWTYDDSVAATTDNAITPGTPVSVTLDGTGAVTLNFGYRLNTVAGQTYADSASYQGNFDVVFSY